MSRLLKIILSFLGVLVVLVLVFIAIIFTVFPRVAPAKDIQVNSTPEFIARGEYLANHVTVCIDCHSSRDWQYFSGPIVPGTTGGGGEVFDENFGFPGRFTAKNITPFGIGNWTDGELYRLITTGVKKNGHPIFPVMPFTSYAHMHADDVSAIIAYLRTLEPIESTPGKSSANFPMNIIMRLIPQNAEPVKPVSSNDRLAYGEYLTRIAGCADCHTAQVKGKPVEGMFLAGGFEFELPSGGIAVSANITPDEETGIGFWEEDDFIDRFKTFDDNYVRVTPGGYNSIMPWMMYAGMTEEDLGAIYTYLQSIKAVNNEVSLFRSR